MRSDFLLEAARAGCFAKRLHLWVLLAWGGVGCVDPDTGLDTGSGDDPTANAEHTSGTEGSRLLRAAYIAARQADASPEYNLWTREGRLRGENPAEGLQLELDRERVRVETVRGEALELTFTGIGRAGQVRTPPEAKLEAAGNRVTYDRGDALEEWYLNGPLGLEQGFVVAEPPPGERGAFVIEVTVAGLEPRLTSNGTEVLLQDGAGATQLRYRDLFASDARGEMLPAHLGVTDATIMLHIGDTDATYPVFVDPLVFDEVDTLTATGGTAGDCFGYSVSIDGDYAIVGAKCDNGDLGSAYVFERSSGIWTQEAHLQASDKADDDYFGASVDISGDYAIVGAFGNDNTSGTGSGYGSAYVFVRSGDDWNEQARLLPDPGHDSEQFGCSVGISGDYAIVGAYGHNTDGIYRGAAYVFKRNITAWDPHDTLIATGGLAWDYFGHSVDISGDYVIVGAPWFHHDHDNGAAFVFERSGTTWVEHKLPASPANDDEFGRSVSISGNYAIVGAHQDDQKGSNAGAAYVFERTATDWIALAPKLTAYDGSAGDRFGSSVSISGELAIVGAYADETQRGVAYPFEYDPTGVGWTARLKLLASDGADNHQFGFSVAISGDDAIVGAPGYVAGAAYVHRAVLPDGSPCSDGAECASGDCVDGVCCAESECAAARGCYRCNVSGSEGACAHAPTDEVCRPGSGDPCDPDEECDGVNDACPPDLIETGEVVCRAGSGDPCDPEETCPGEAGVPCPTDVIEPYGTLCRSGSGDDCDPDEECTGNAEAPCPMNVVQPSGHICNAGSGDVCDPDEECSGNPGEKCPNDRIEPTTTVCREGSGDMCDAGETCTGVADAPCPALVLPTLHVCREGSGDVCNPAESCNGIPGVPCPEDVFAPSGMMCRDATDVCDAQEQCVGDGSACPPDQVQPHTTLCREAMHECDAPEFCNGVLGSCPDDEVAANGTPCDDDQWCTKGDECTDGVCIGERVDFFCCDCDAAGSQRGFHAGWMLVLGLLASRRRRTDLG
ncbi:MAG: hypothetical protein JRI25_09655 [Deltaproteobacteria bacterium]|nr:hypothetical protein [Deltaproteobacteria bacterium]